MRKEICISIHTSIGDNQLISVFEPASAQVCIAVLTSTAHFPSVQHIFHFAVLSAVSTCDRGTYAWQSKSEQPAYAVNAYVTTIASL